MTEPRWRNIDTITEEMYRGGRWYWQGSDGGTSASPAFTSHDFFMSLVVRGAIEGQAYGPIPDPPEPPPKLRRFEATYKGVRVSGAFVKGETVEAFARIWRWDDGIAKPYTGCADWRELTEIEWIDPEESC